MTRLSASCLLLSLLLDTASIPADRPAAIGGTASHDYVFAQRITFVLEASSETRITRAVLHYQADDLPLQSIDGQFAPETLVRVEASLELRGGVIPPFSTVTYWWEFGDESGQTAQTPRAAFEYIDNRFNWQTATDAGITVRWSDGDAAFGESALDVAQDAMPTLVDEIGASPPVVEIYLYPSREQLISTLRLGGRDWAGGQARPELGVVLVDVPNSPAAASEMRRLIPHELTHLLVYQAAQPHYDRVPTWLNEGLATANEWLPDPDLEVALDDAFRTGRLLPFESLCAPFPAEVDAARLAYAQSGSLVQFVRDRYGGQGIRALLAAYRQNATCAAGVERALGISLQTLESDWRAGRRAGSGQGIDVGAVAGAGAPWLALSGLACLTLLPMIAPFLARRRR